MIIVMFHNDVQYFNSVLASEDSEKNGQRSEKSDKLLKRGFRNWEER